MTLKALIATHETSPNPDYAYIKHLEHRLRILKNQPHIQRHPMTYEITIERLEDDPGNAKYPNKIEVYSQRVEDLDLKAVIIAVNKLNYDT